MIHLVFLEQGDGGPPCAASAGNRSNNRHSNFLTPTGDVIPEPLLDHKALSKNVVVQPG